MGHTKTIQSGNQIEVWNYERELPYIAHGPRKKKQIHTDLYSFKTVLKRRDNISRQKKNFVRLVQANLAGTDAPIFLTLTMREVVEISEANKSFNRFSTKIRQRLGKEIRYISVPEFQKRGAVHFHVLIWGLEENLIKTERHTRFIAKLWSEGFIDLKKTDGSIKLAGYLGKYMAKSLSDPRLSMRRAYNASRNVKRPAVFSGGIIKGYFKEVFGIELSTDTPCYEKQYTTQWLGRCDYKVYEIKT